MSWKGDSYRQSALIPTCAAPDSILHANVYDQDQGLTRRYHNTTLKVKKPYKHHITNQGPRGPEYKCPNINESAEATISEYIHKLNKVP
jgi:hypothetical protein